MAEQKPPDPPEFLTAAECATRTGLTPRALRVYEEYGLIDPQRSAAGWRYYGSRELVKLNTISLLKTAGLSLAQIRDVTRARESDPTLQQVLEIQRDTWSSRQAEAQRGRAVVEAALQRLQAQSNLSVEELCNLIRSLEMSQALPTSPLAGQETPADVTVDLSILDSYAGLYQRREYGVGKIWREGQKLMLDAPVHIPGTTRAYELHATSDTEFYINLGPLSLQYRFLRDADGKVSAVVVRQQGVEFTSPRIDEAAAEDLRAKLAARIQSNSPLPGSEAALRRLVEGIQTGNPPYEEMSPQLAQVVRQQLHQLQPVAAYLGAIRAIEFRGVGSEGWDVYDVHREHGASRWRILLSPDGKIALANAVVTEAPASAGP